MVERSRLAHHQIAGLSTHVDFASGALGYVLDGVSYGVMNTGRILSAQELTQAHAAVLGVVQLDPREAGPEAKQAAALAFALHRLGEGHELGRAERATLHAAQFSTEQGEVGKTVHIRTDGSADKGKDGKNALSVGYLLNAKPYSLALHGRQGHEGIAERTAIFTALTHARVLGFREFRVQSDHKFHTRRYDEDLIHRNRRKSDSLERLDALVDELQPHIHFEYAATLDTDAPHRLALHARALDRLSLGLGLSRAQAMALRRVHFAFKKGGDVLF